MSEADAIALRGNLRRLQQCWEIALQSRQAAKRSPSGLAYLQPTIAHKPKPRSGATSCGRTEYVAPMELVIGLRWQSRKMSHLRCWLEEVAYNRGVSGLFRRFWNRELPLLFHTVGFGADG